MNFWNFLEVIGPLATAAAVLVAAWQIKEAKKHAITDFEDDLDREYRQIIYKIPVKALLGQDLTEQEYHEALVALYQYVDLSNNQVFLRQAGRVSGKTWTFWRDGIKSNLSREPFRRAWNEIKEKGQSSFSELRRLENSGFREDPRRWSR
jgi:hypothetical protein